MSSFSADIYPTSLHEVVYPESDGQPMAETEVHASLMTDVKLMLEHRFRAREDVHVGMNLLLYYVEGDPTQRVAPDVFVTFGMDKAPRRTYRLWAEGKAPDVVFEMTSKGTRVQDLGVKKGLYEVIGVREYFLVDPHGEYLQPPLQGYRLEESGSYARIEGGSLTSELLGVTLAWEDDGLVLRDDESGERLLRPIEQAERAEKEAERAENAEARARELEAELERLRQAGDD